MMFYFFITLFLVKFYDLNIFQNFSMWPQGERGRRNNEVNWIGQCVIKDRIWPIVMP